MESKQWVFWATAIPLTIIIILLVLVWAGELQRFWIGLRKLFSGRRDRYANYQPIPETFPVVNNGYTPQRPQVGPVILNSRRRPTGVHAPAVWDGYA